MWRESRNCADNAPRLNKLFMSLPYYLDGESPCKNSAFYCSWQMSVVDSRRGLFTRSPFPIGLLIGQSHNQGDETNRPTPYTHLQSDLSRARPSEERLGGEPAEPLEILDEMGLVVVTGGMRDRS